MNRVATAERQQPRRGSRAGIETTVVAAVGTTRRGLVGESFLITREIADSVPLDQVVRGRLASAEQRNRRAEASRFRRELARALGRSSPGCISFRSSAALFRR